jgi:DNA polymerase-3 subunit epsilon
MREIVLDTETTGFDPFSGDRIVEIGAIELMNHVATGRVYHQYINPQRDMPEGAFKVHGLSQEFLSDKLLFADIAEAFLEFAGDAKFVIHNAEFDMKFLNWEYGQLNQKPFGQDRAIDTLAIARRKFPGSPASLDALCKRFGVDNSGRDLHGALIDCELLAEVYLELIGGREPGFKLGLSGSGDENAGGGIVRRAPRPSPLTSLVTDEERAAHEALVESLGEKALWAGK